MLLSNPYLTKTSPLENFDTLPKPYRSIVLKAAIPCTNLVLF
nr:MAG TPA: hypothetical protein [Caudoviricetes sp.]